MAKPITPRKRVRAGQATMVSAKGKKTIFDYYNDRGLIPVKNASGERFKNFEEFKNLVQTATTAYLNANPGVTPTKALNFTLSRLELLRKLRTKEWLDSFDEVVKASEAKKGTIYKGIPFKINDSGEVDFNKRKYMENVPQPVYDYIADTRGEDVAKEYKKAVKKEWEDMGARGREFKGKTGVEVHRGHWLANKFGGAESARAGDLEIAMMNVLHGADPRGNIEAVKESSRSSMGWLDDFYEWDLVNNKLNVPGSELLTIEDLQGISANEVDVNQRIAQRLEQQRMGTLPESRTGNLFQAEVFEGETLEQARFRKQESQARDILEYNFNPQTGNPATASDITKAKNIIKEAESQMRATTVGPRAQTNIVPNPANVTKLPSQAYSRGIEQSGGKVRYSAARRATKLIPLVPFGLAMAETATKGAQAAQASMQGDAARASQLGDEAALAAAEGIVGEILPGIGDVFIADPAADTTLEGAARTRQQIQAERQQKQQRRQEEIKAYQEAMKPKPQSKPTQRKNSITEARKTGGKMKIGGFTLPEFGISEALGIN